MTKYIIKTTGCTGITKYQLSTEEFARITGNNCAKFGKNHANNELR